MTMFSFKTSFIKIFKQKELETFWTLKSVPCQLKMRGCEMKCLLKVKVSKNNLLSWKVHQLCYVILDKYLRALSVKTFVILF